MGIKQGVKRRIKKILYEASTNFMFAIFVMLGILFLWLGVFCMIGIGIRIMKIIGGV